MRSLVFALVLALAACTEPAATTAPPIPAPPPVADPYASAPRCKAHCEDQLSRVRCNPPDCPTMDQCMSTCREPSPTP